MKKKLNIILLLGVLGLWSTVVYKYVSHFFQDGQTEVSFQNNIVTKLPAKIEKDTFSLSSLPTDPFLKSGSLPKTAPPKTILINSTSSSLPKPKKVTPKPIKPVKIIEEAPFPDVKFYGYIKSQDKVEELILVKVNNSLYRTRLNADCNGVLIKKIYRDSLEVKFEKRKLTVLRQR